MKLFYCTKEAVILDLFSSSSSFLTQGFTTLKLSFFFFVRSLQPKGLADTVCGSPLYMAPEVMQRHKYDAKVKFSILLMYSVNNLSLLTLRRKRRQIFGVLVLFFSS